MCRCADVEGGHGEWIAPDVALPGNPSVVWRKRRFPTVVPRDGVHGLRSVMERLAPGMGVRIVPRFLAESRKDLLRLTEPLDECEADLGLCTRPESRHVRRVGVVYAHFGQAVCLP